MAVAPPPTGRRTRSIGLLGLVVAGLLVLLLMPAPATTRLASLLRELAHVGMGALLAVAVGRVLLGRGWRPGPAAAVAAAGTVLFLGLMELVQPLVGRSASWSDLRATALGVATGIAFQHSFRRRGRARLLLGLAGAMFLGLAVLAPTRLWLDIRRQTRAFPLLASYEQEAALSGWAAHDATIERTRGHATHGIWSLKATLLRGAFPTISSSRLPHDWRGYGTLAFDVDLAESSPFELLLKVEDLDHEFAPAFRSITRLPLQPGPNSLRIPLAAILAAPRGGRLNPGRIAGLALMAVDLETPRSFWVDHIRLERGAPAD